MSDVTGYNKDSLSLRRELVKIRKSKSNKVEKQNFNKLSLRLKMLGGEDPMRRRAVALSSVIDE